MYFFLMVTDRKEYSQKLVELYSIQFHELEIFGGILSSYRQNLPANYLLLFPKELQWWHTRKLNVSTISYTRLCNENMMKFTEFIFEMEKFPKFCRALSYPKRLNFAVACQFCNDKNYFSKSFDFCLQNCNS